jgi:hypothetical protein
VRGNSHQLLDRGGPHLQGDAKGEQAFKQHRQRGQHTRGQHMHLAVLSKLHGTGNSHQRLNRGVRTCGSVEESKGKCSTGNIRMVSYCFSRQAGRRTGKQMACGPAAT